MNYSDLYIHQLFHFIRHLEMVKKHALLVASSIVSLLMLAIFLYLHSKNPQLLKLDIPWIVISFLPFLISLFVGDYIHKIKGFGVELERKFNAPVNSISLTAADAIDKFPGSTKESLPDLHRVSAKQKRYARRLGFNYDKKGYYDTEAIAEYIRSLPNIEYLEVKREDGKFVCLLPISLFMANPDCIVNADIYIDVIEKFRVSIDENNLLSVFSGSAIILAVTSSASLIDVLRTLRKNDSLVAGVVSTDGKLVGVITAPLVEKRIADEVLGVKTNAKL